MITIASGDWRGTKDWLEERIGEMQLKLEAVEIPERSADALRGGIKAYRDLIAQAEKSSTTRTTGLGTDYTKK